MLVFSLIFTTILLGVSIGVAHKGPKSEGWMAFLMTGTIVILLPSCFMLFPPVILSFVFLGVALGIWTVSRSRIRRFWPMGVTAVLLAYLIMGGVMLAGKTPYGRYRQEYPVESMTERVPESGADRSPLPEPARTRLSSLELAIENTWEYRLAEMRRTALRDLHEDRVREFVATPGFGLGRMPSPTDWLQAPSSPRTPEQSVEWPSTDHGTGPGRVPSPDSSPVLADLHQNGLLEFLNLAGFGYARDRTRVAGFQPHGFRKTPVATGSWRLDRVELVSLLLHAEPAVYMTAQLPTMEGVREFPTRPLDRFESESLKQLRAGEDMVSAGGPKSMRAFGSIRSTKHCVACHGGEWGDLLGAFSYVLREGGEKKP